MTFGLVAIVKDEAERIGALIDSVRPLISSWTIVDTGSTDGTQRVILEGLVDVPGRLLEEPFVDFGTTRSVAFAAARGTADWLLALDADMTIVIDEGWTPDPTVDAYMLRMGGKDFEWRLPLLLRGDRHWVSRGAVHEYTLLADGSLGVRAATDAARIANRGMDRWTPEKGHWHAALLEAELERSPGDPRATFYLAQTLRELGDLSRARELYAARATMGGWDEEIFYAHYRAALLEPDWPARLAALLAAWETRPHRLEPLYHALRGLNATGQHRVAYALAQVVDPARRTADVLFVEPGVWAWGIAFERSIAAWWVGRRAEFEALTGELLERDLPAPIRAQVEANAALAVAA